MFSLWNVDNRSYDELPTPISAKDFMDLSRDLIREKIDWINSDGWEVIHDEDGIIIEERAIEGSDIELVRASSVLTGVNYHELIELAYNSSIEERKKVSDDIIDHEVLDYIADNIHVCISKYEAPIGITNREFVNLRTHKPLSTEKHVIVVHSINYDKAPSDSDYIRGTNRNGVLFEKLNDSAVKITTVDHVDPKGWIPAIVINAFKKKAGIRIKKIQLAYGK